MHKYLIYAIFFLALFGGLIYSFGVPQYLSIATEILIYCLLVFSLIARIITGKDKGLSMPHLWYSFLSMILIGTCSIALNSIDPTRAIFSLRLLYRFYFFYLGLIIMDLNDDTLKNVNMFVAILLLLQFPVIAVKFSKWGISEKTMGAYAIHDGSVATTLPISVIFYLSAYYFLYRPQRRYIFAGVGCILFSIAAMKRAVFFLYPVQFLAIYYYIYLKGTMVYLSKKIGMLLLILSLILVVSISLLRLNATLNPEKQVGGSIDFGYALDYASKYNEGMDGYGYTWGRIATTKRAFEILLSSGFGQLLVGVGPGSTTPSLLDSAKDRKRFLKRFDKFKILYGMTTMNRVLLEYGVFGVAAFSLMLCLLAYMCWSYYKLEVDPYWKAFAGGSVGFSFSMLFFAFAYHSTAFWGDTMPALYFYAMAVVYTRLKRITLPIPRSVAHGYNHI